MEARPVEDCIWEIPATEKPGMRVPALIYASEALLAQMDKNVFEQLTNVACLPGIVRAALCMPDGHSGYGFPIGGVAAFRADTGAGVAYKDLSAVVEVLHRLRLSRKVATLAPIGNIKG